MVDDMARIVLNVNSELRDLSGHGKCLTAGALIEALKGCDPRAVVLAASDYGDYRHTEQALPVASVTIADSRRVGPSAYSGSGLCILPQTRDVADAVPVVILK